MTGCPEIELGAGPVDPCFFSLFKATLKIQDVLKDPLVRLDGVQRLLADGVIVQIGSQSRDPLAQSHGKITVQIERLGDTIVARRSSRC